MRVLEVQYGCWLSCSNCTKNYDQRSSVAQSCLRPRVVSCLSTESTSSSKCGSAFYSGNHSTIGPSSFQYKKYPYGHRYMDGIQYVGSCRYKGKAARKKILQGNSRHAVDHDSASTATSSGTVHPPAGSKETANEEVLTGLTALDVYFSKLHGANHSQIVESSTGNVSNGVTGSIFPLEDSANELHSSGCVESIGLRNYEKVPQGLEALNAYFDKLHPTREDTKEKPAQLETNKLSSITVEEECEFNAEAEEETGKEKEEEDDDKDGDYFISEEILKEIRERFGGNDVDIMVKARSEKISGDLDVSGWTLENGDSEDSYLVENYRDDPHVWPEMHRPTGRPKKKRVRNLIVAINIAVYIFGLASPHEAMGITDSSLPFVYGAKINDLILEGQWWRFVTPMFLHSGLLHLGLGSWALLSFGPAVESAYGSLGFGMIYFLGGMFGDLMSFFHTSEATVGGTGPIYALVGTWVVYLLKNNDIIGKEMADDMIRKVVFMTALNVALCNSLPIDDWSHLGAAFIGLLFGALTCPTLDVNVSIKELAQDGEEEEKESLVWVTESLHPVKLVLVFSLCIGLFLCLYNFGLPFLTDVHLLEETGDFS